MQIYKYKKKLFVITIYEEIICFLTKKQLK